MESANIQPNSGFNNQIETDGNQGRWSAEEHSLFAAAVNQFGRDWEKVQAVVRTRSLAQVRSHAQKYFLKLSKSEDLERQHDHEMWTLAGQPTSSSISAFVVLDIMSSVLRKLKHRRDALCGISGGGGPPGSSVSGSTSSVDSSSEGNDDNERKRRKLDISDVARVSMSDTAFKDGGLV